MNYYNEIDPKAAAWLRELIRQGHIPTGHVDERSIVDVRPHELTQYTQCHFFAGIGGWPLALQLAGVPPTQSLWSMSCPCQPFSTAGKGLAQADERHLWPVAFDLIRECRPDTVVGEQVASAIGHGWLDGISADLEGEGYSCGAVVLGAHSVNAPHQRQRLYWVAHNNNKGSQGRECGELSKCAFKLTSGASGACSGLVLPNSDGCSAGSSASTTAGHRNTIEPAGSWIDGLADTNGSGSLDGINGAEGWRAEAVAQHSSNIWNDFTLVHCRDGKIRRVPTEPAFFPLAHGVPARVVRLRGYGNAIVPQVAAEFVKASFEAINDPLLGVW